MAVNKKMLVKKLFEIAVRHQGDLASQPWPNPQAESAGLRWWGTFASPAGSADEMAEALTRLQNDAGITGEQLAQLLSIKPSSLSQWKAGKYKPSLQAFMHLVRFAASINHPLTTFFWMRFTGFGAAAIADIAEAALNEKADQLSKIPMYHDGRPAPPRRGSWELLLAAADRILKAREAAKARLQEGGAKD